MVNGELGEVIESGPQGYVEAGLLSLGSSRPEIAQFHDQSSLKK
jgi:hypothetical protein